MLEFFQNLIRTVSRKDLVLKKNNQRMNPFEKIQFEKEYVTGIMADTELHAGGIFFCVPYEEVLTFYSNERVELKRRVIETGRPMDGQSDIDKINSFQLKGKSYLSSRNYIDLSFTDLSMTGLPLEEHPNTLVFNCYNKPQGFGYGRAYTLKRDIE